MINYITKVSILEHPPSAVQNNNTANNSNPHTGLNTHVYTHIKNIYIYMTLCEKFVFFYPTLFVLCL